MLRFAKGLGLILFVKSQHFCSLSDFYELKMKVRVGSSKKTSSTLALPEMAAWQSKTTRQLWQATILARDVVDTFSKCHYFSEILQWYVIR